MTTGQDRQNGSFSGGMRTLNLDVPEFSGDFQSMNYSQLANAKRSVESSLEHLYTLLHETHKFDMTQPLVIDGFPRDDVDVVTIRLIRANIDRLTNDHIAILGHIQEHLMQQLQPPTNPIASEDTNTHRNDSSKHENEIIHARAFALVKDVVADSPAAKAGLLIGDRILTFDEDIGLANHNNLTAVAMRVKAKKDLYVSVEILRGSHRMTLLLVPTENWAGRGLLGCHIVPI